MIAIAFLFVRVLCDCFKSRRRLETEILVLRHQLNVLEQRAPRRLHLRWADRALFIWLYRRCPRILDAVTIVRPETVVRWHRMGFAAYWRWKSRPRGGRPRIGKEVRDLDAIYRWASGWLVQVEAQTVGESDEIRQRHQARLGSGVEMG